MALSRNDMLILGGLGAVGLYFMTRGGAGGGGGGTLQAVADVTNHGTGEFTLDASQSSSPTDDPVQTYQWTVDGVCGNGDSDTATYTGVTATHLSSCGAGLGPHDYTFTLTVTTQSGATATDTVTATLQT